MDTEPCGFETFRDCLVDLARVNRMTLAYRPTLAFLVSLEKADLLPRDRPLRIVDVASGYGDMLRRIAAWASGRGIAVDLTGIDLNPWSTRAASEATPAELGITWINSDIFDYSAEGRADLILSSLFTHHLDDAALIRFLAWMEATASLGWFVNDLHRHALPYAVFSRASRAMRMHRFVQHDGPVSIARSFVVDDWRRLLAAAGIPPGAAEIHWWMPFRLCVSRVRGR